MHLIYRYRYTYIYAHMYTHKHTIFFFFKYFKLQHFDVKISNIFLYYSIEPATSYFSVNDLPELVYTTAKQQLSDCCMLFTLLGTQFLIGF